MPKPTVLIVEDEILIALDVEAALSCAGFEVCGIAHSEAEAMKMAADCRPDLAIVDIGLSPGDGRNVAKALSNLYGTGVLFASGQCHEVAGLRGTGAIACLPKPYRAEVVPAAFEALRRLHAGDRSRPLPGFMYPLAA